MNKITLSAHSARRFLPGKYLLRDEKNCFRFMLWPTAQIEKSLCFCAHSYARKNTNKNSLSILRVVFYQESTCCGTLKMPTTRPGIFA